MYSIFKYRSEKAIFKDAKYIYTDVAVIKREFADHMYI